MGLYKQMFAFVSTNLEREEINLFSIDMKNQNQ